MFYTVYKVTNQITGKIYIGCHKTLDLDDSYMGSGKYLKRSQEKHGMHNFTKEILFVYDNSKDMFSKEAELVNADFVTEENTYNIKVGGCGGFQYVNENGLNTQWKDREARAAKLSISHKNRIANGGYLSPEFLGDTRSEEFIENALLGAFRGMSHAEESKKAIGLKNAIHQKGAGNSQYGTMWIHSPELRISKRIKKEEPIPDGWCKGRKIY